MDENRSLTKIRKLFEANGAYKTLTSSSDMGVRRNGGRNGTRFGPQVILEQFKNMTFHSDQLKFQQQEVSSQLNERLDFNKAQIHECDCIHDQLNGNNLLHIGGGHDHIYPLLMALSKNYKDILVLNIDAHCDTRTDATAHSGNPFRKFDLNKDKNVNFKLVQFGIHPYANSPSTIKPLTNSNMTIIEDATDLQELSKVINNENTKDSAFVLSLDADGLSSDVMKAVSAVNHYGVSSKTMKEILELYKNTKASYKAFGIYEYNPIYEDLSLSGARFLADLIYQYYY